jgi:acetyl-CoA C-acetyltransferase
VATLAKMLHEKGNAGGRPALGLVSVCAAGGQGVVALLEAYTERNTPGDIHD